MNLELLDSNVQNVILGVVANGVTGILGQAGRQLRKVAVGDKTQEIDLPALLKRSIQSVADAIQWTGPGRLEEICLYLCSPEVEEYVRQIYATQALQTPLQSSYQAIQQQFIASMAMFVGLPETKTKGPGEILFNALVAGCEKTLQTSIEAGVLTAHEARSSVRFRILRDEIAAIQRSLEQHNTGGRISLQGLRKFEEKYRRQVASRHRHLVPPHFDSARKIPIDSIFVAPSFTTTPRRKGEEVCTLSASEFLSQAYRAVILGNPGGGKSTLSAKVCHDLCTLYSNRLLAGRQVTPILVILRDYGAEKKLHKASILDFIEATANSNYQIKPLAGAFDYMLLKGRSLVIFDGLDELLDTAYRQEVSNDIESFCELYPAVPVLVTSREVGYEQAPLDEERFSVFRLAPFNENQVQDYVRKWFGTDNGLTAPERKAKASGFLSESRMVPDLRSNPLMLGLMCSIYRGDNYIPKNRPDVYEKCAMMLFERWDKSRGILVPLPFEAHIRPAMMNLASWIYGDESLQGGVTEDKLISKAADYLAAHRFDERAEAEGAARSFIEFCRGRAWVFTDTGTTKEGQRLYQFTHRTFLEYFAAANLVRTNPTPEALARILLPRIERREWDVVAQLAFQLLNRNVESGGDDLLAGVVKRSAEIDEQSRWNLLSFAVRCLEFMVPSPKIVKSIVQVFLERYLAWGRNLEDATERRNTLYHEDQPVESLASLLACAAENRPIVGSSIEGFLKAQIERTDDEIRRCLALELSRNFELALHRRHHQLGEPPAGCSEFWNQMSERWSTAFRSRTDDLVPTDFRSCLALARLEKLPLSKVVEWYGLEGLFRGCPYPMLALTFPSLVEMGMYTAFWSANSPKGKRKLAISSSLLQEVGRLLLQANTLVNSNIVADADLRSFPRHVFDFTGGGPPRLDRDTLFGVVSGCAVLMELVIYKNPERDSLVKQVKEIPVPLLRTVLLARLQAAPEASLLSELTRAAFTKDQEQFLLRWTRKEISLTSVPAAEATPE